MIIYAVCSDFRSGSAFSEFVLSLYMYICYLRQPLFGVLSVPVEDLVNVAEDDLILAFHASRH